MLATVFSLLIQLCINASFLRTICFFVAKTFALFARDTNRDIFWCKNVILFIKNFDMFGEN